MQIKRILLLILLWAPTQALAWSWQDLWSRDDQQGKAFLDNNEASKAAKKFQDPNWQSFAHYRAGEYQAAVNALKDINTDVAHYNRANALAQSGQYEDAIKAYTQALALNEQHLDAAYNKKLLEDYLKEDPPPKDDKQDSEDNQDNDNTENKDNNADSNQQNQDKEKNQQENNQDHSSEEENAQEQNKNESPQEVDPASLNQGFTAQQQTSPEISSENAIDAVQDNPGGLLRQKFLRDYLRMKPAEQNK